MTKPYSHNRTYVLLYIVQQIVQQEEDMRLLRLAVENQRWDLVAHTIILATARLLNNGGKLNDRKSREKKRRPKRQAEC